MPTKRTRRAPKRAPKRRRFAPKRTQRKARLPRNMPEMASCSESWTTQILNTNTMYRLQPLRLADFIRASTISQGYAQFRMTRITLRFRPLADTFPVGAVGGQIPYLYYQLDKSGAVPNPPTISQLRAMGSIPRRLDDKTLNVSWAPTVLSVVNDSALAPPIPAYGNKPVLHPWLNTNNIPSTNGGAAPSEVGHYGLYYIVDQQGATTTAQYEVEVTAEFQFKSPRFDTNGQNESPVNFETITRPAP